MPDLATALKQAIDNIHNKEKQMTTTNTTQATNASLSALANQWAAEDKAAAPSTAQVINNTGPNTSRTTFNFVRDNPGHRKDEILESLSAKGLNPNSVATLLTQMAMCRSLRREEDGRYYANEREYVPVRLGVLKAMRKANKRLAKAEKNKAVVAKRATYKPRAPRAPAVVEQTAAPIPAPVQNTETFNPDTYLSQLSFTQVLALYKHLKQVLGNV